MEKPRLIQTTNGMAVVDHDKTRPVTRITSFKGKIQQIERMRKKGLSGISKVSNRCFLE